MSVIWYIDQGGGDFMKVGAAKKMLESLTEKGTLSVIRILAFEGIHWDSLSEKMKEAVMFLFQTTGFWK